MYDIGSLESPLLWIRGDPELEYLAELHLLQPEHMWVCSVTFLDLHDLELFKVCRIYELFMFVYYLLDASYQVVYPWWFGPLSDQPIGER